MRGARGSLAPAGETAPASVCPRRAVCASIAYDRRSTNMASPVRLTYDHETHNVCGCTTGISSGREGRRDRRRRRLPSCSADESPPYAATPA